MNPAAIFWVVLMVIFLVVEAACPIHLVSVWFAAGALISAIVGQFGGEIWLQVVVFLVISGVSLALLRPIAKKYFTPKITHTNVDAMTGKLCQVVADIDNSTAVGQVKLGDVEWSARSTDGSPIPAGVQVRIDRVEGVKVYVTPVTVAVK